MKYIIIAVIGLFIALLVFSSDGSQEPSGEQQSVQSITELEKALADGAAFLDVRTPEEYYESHFPGAELVPLQEIEQGRLPEYGTETTLYIYCRSGNRSQEAAKILETAGYIVVDLGGLPDVAALGGQLTEDTCPLGDSSICLREYAPGGAI